jgi:hypothetical protein
MATVYTAFTTGYINSYSGSASLLTIPNEYIYNNITYKNPNVTGTVDYLSVMNTNEICGPISTGRYSTSATNIYGDLFNNVTSSAASPYVMIGDHVTIGDYEVVFDLEAWKDTPAYETMKKQAKLFKLKSQLAIVVKSRACPVNGVSEAEQRALDTLREMVSESDFRKYLKHGFLMIRGASGDMYQVHRDRHHTKIWRNGKVAEEVCVRIKDPSVPPTDNVIAFKTAIEVSEEAFKAMGNVYNMRSQAA